MAALLEDELGNVRGSHGQVMVVPPWDVVFLQEPQDLHVERFGCGPIIGARAGWLNPHGRRCSFLAWQLSGLVDIQGERQHGRVTACRPDPCLAVFCLFNIQPRYQEFS